MKRNILYTLWAAAVLLTSCTPEEFPRPGAEGANILSITVTDGGYTPPGENGLQKAVTRATENGYRTDFTAGDACGLYIVRPGENGVRRTVYENIKLTATETNGTLTWTPEADVTLAGGLAEERYFLYYPYQETAEMAGKTDASATNDAGFFAPLIDDWQPKADQSDHTAGYTASDLMTATGTATKDGKQRKLSFAMSHRMALAIIEMPKTVYHFTNTTGGKIPDYVIVSDVEFTPEARPYRTEYGDYRYIVRPQSAAARPLTGSYDEGMKEFTLSPKGITAGRYKTYKIDGGQTVIKNHDLQVGDFLLADGSLVGKDKLTEAQKASVSAIVFWTPAETDPTGRNTPASLTDDRIMSAQHPDCTHGLAVAVKKVTYKNSELMVWQPDGSYDHVKAWQANNFTHTSKENFVSIASNPDADDNINKIYGYQNTLVLLAYNAYCQTGGGNPASIVQPVAALDVFKASNPAPAGSTGWFLPSAKELHMLCYQDVDNVYSQYGTTTRDIVNTSLSAAGGDDLVAEYYWSSSEVESLSGNAFEVNFLSARVSYWSKSNTYRVRAVCAF